MTKEIDYDFDDFEIDFPEVIVDQSVRPPKELARVTTWEARAAAMRLLFGDSLVLPPRVVIKPTIRRVYENQT